MGPRDARTLLDGERTERISNVMVTPQQKKRVAEFQKAWVASFSGLGVKPNRGDVIRWLIHRGLQAEGY
jgi:hypothetical protein